MVCWMLRPTNRGSSCLPTEEAQAYQQRKQQQAYPETNQGVSSVCCTVDSNRRIKGLFLKPRTHKTLQNKYLCVYSTVKYPDLESVLEISRDYQIHVEDGIYDGQHFSYNYGKVL